MRHDRESERSIGGLDSHSVDMSVTQCYCSCNGSKQSLDFTKDIFCKGANMLSGHVGQEIAIYDQTSAIRERDRETHSFLLLIKQILNSLKGINAHIVQA